MIRKIIALSLVVIAVSTVFSVSGCKKEKDPEPVIPAATVEEAETAIEGAVEDHSGHNHD